MYLILGLLGVIVVLAGEFTLSLLADFSILQFMIVKLPVGAYFLGVVLGWFLAKGVKASGKKLRAVHYVTALVLALGTFYGIHYQWYKTSYFHYDNGKWEINGIAENGVNVDEFEYVDEEMNKVKMNLRTYLYVEYDDANEMTSFENRRMVTMTRFKEVFPEYVFQVLSILLTTVITVISMTKRYQYCENCKKYYKSKKLFDMSQVNVDSEVSEFKSRIANKSGVDEFIKKNRQKPKENTYYRAELEYCTSCNTGHVLVKEMEKQSLRFRGSEIVENRRTLDIDRGTIEEII